MLRRDPRGLVECGPRLVELVHAIRMHTRLFEQEVGALLVVARVRDLGVDELREVRPQRAPVEHAADRPQVRAQRRIEVDRAPERFDRARFVGEPALVELAELVREERGAARIGQHPRLELLGHRLGALLATGVAEPRERLVDDGRVLEQRLERPVVGEVRGPGADLDPEVLRVLRDVGRDAREHLLGGRGRRRLPPHPPLERKRWQVIRCPRSAGRRRRRRRRQLIELIRGLGARLRRRVAATRGRNRNGGRRQADRRRRARHRNRGRLGRRGNRRARAHAFRRPGNRHRARRRRRHVRAQHPGNRRRDRAIRLGHARRLGLGRRRMRRRMRRRRRRHRRFDDLFDVVHVDRHVDARLARGPSRNLERERVGVGRIRNPVAQLGVARLGVLGIGHERVDARGESVHALGGGSAGFGGALACARLVFGWCTQRSKRSSPGARGVNAMDRHSKHLVIQTRSDPRGFPAW